MNPAAAQPAHEISDAFTVLRQTLDGWTNGFVQIIPNLIAAALVALLFVVLALFASATLRHLVRRAGRYDLAHMLASFAFWSTIFIGFLVVITILLPSMRAVDIFASLGIGSVALGFAFKDILQNWIAGFFILIRRPFHRGDQIKIGDIEGTVQAVETRATLVKTFSGRLVIVPNSDIYTRAVTVNTAYEHRRSEIVVPVGLEVDLDRVADILRAATLAVPDVLPEPPPDVLPWEFSNNNVNIRVRWWTKPQRAYEVRTRAAVLAAVKRACAQAGIALPADTKISFAETPLNVRQAAAQPHKRKPLSAKKYSGPRIAAGQPDERLDPEAEKPKGGELNEGVEDLPR